MIGHLLASMIVGLLAATWFYEYAAVIFKGFVASRRSANLLGFIFVFLLFIIGGSFLSRKLRGALKRQPKVRKFLEDRAADQAAKFIEHWKETFDAPGREAWWTEFLSKPVARPNISAPKKRKRAT